MSLQRRESGSLAFHLLEEKTKRKIFLFFSACFFPALTFPVYTGFCIFPFPVCRRPLINKRCEHKIAIQIQLSQIMSRMKQKSSHL